MHTISAELAPHWSGYILALTQMHTASADLAPHWHGCMQPHSPRGMPGWQANIRGILRIAMVRPIHLRHFGCVSICAKAVSPVGSS